ncbi:hypothetical protein GCM10027047_37910 [Rhodococcus aerolatus]
MRPVQRGRRRDEELAALPAADQREAAREACLRALASRPRSRSELHRRLVDAGHEAGVVDGVLDRLTEAGLVDDAAFAAQWVRSRHGGGAGRSRRVLARELGQKGVDPEHVDVALEQVDDESERERALELARRGARRAPVPTDRAGRAAVVRRLVGQLARRGYPTSLALAVVAEALDEQALDEQALDEQDDLDVAAVGEDHDPDALGSS